MGEIRTPRRKSPEDEAAFIALCPLWTCACAVCISLRAEVDDDSLIRLYGRKLLSPGWAGGLTPAERAYQRAHGSGLFKSRTPAWLRSPGEPTEGTVKFPVPTRLGTTS